MRLLFTTLQIAIIVILASCTKEDTHTKQIGKIQFSIGNISVSSLKSTNTPGFVLVSIKDANGNMACSLQEIELYEFEGNYISKPISLNPGEYKLSEFFVLDGNKKVIYASPLAGSKMAQFVNNPLEIGFSIAKDITSKLTPEVVIAKDKTPEDFGYNTFGFDIVDTFDFLIGVFAYDSTTNNFELTNASLTIKSLEGNIINTDTLKAITNQVTTKNGYSDYILEITKQDYSDYLDTIACDSLKIYIKEPLNIILNVGSNLKTLVLQPGSEEGKDAHLRSITPNDNRGDFYFFESKAWTTGGTENHMRSIVEFDLSSIPSMSKIVNANLFLFHDADRDPVNTGHSKLSGSNECIIKRITSPWEEMKVTWNTRPTTTDINQVYVQESDSVDQNYIIDVTQLVQDMIDFPEESHGFMMQLVNETPYRRLTFASSDTDNPYLYPKLEVTYSY